MTAIDLREKARQLGVSLEDDAEGHRKMARYLSEHRSVPIHQRKIDAIKALPEREMIAVIRMEGWDIHRPDLFTKDGLKSTA